ncbi:hypothetical protein H8356DRAFT_1315277 [Neocallimastix lanati (nom. inval.)]|nr:hypothetical protein H8356DRAFT_1315277 [Neocallimastix sp. JGI-2020a]
MNETLPDVSLMLSIVDTIPVIFFFFTTILIAKKLIKVHIFGSILFYFGSIISFIGGILQVIWKLVIAIQSKNIKIFHTQFKFSLSGGFIIMILSIIISHSKINWKATKIKLLKIPCIIFIIIIILCFISLLIFMFKLDSNKSSTNWIEECSNIIMQGSVFLCTLIATKNNKVDNQDFDKECDKNQTV